MITLFLILRSLIFYLGYVIVTVVLALASFLLVWFFPDSQRHLLHKLWCTTILKWCRLCCGIHYHVQGLENITGNPVVVLANHQSEWETMFIYRYLAPVCPILKKELIEIPVYGWAMRLVKPIAIDRSKLHEAGKSILKQGRQRLESGRSVMIFPEGTRTTPGGVKKFSRSGARLAIEAGVPILPIAHNSGQCWPRQFIKYPGTIHVNIGQPLPTNEQDATLLTNQVEDWIRQHVVDQSAPQGTAVIDN